VLGSLSAAVAAAVACSSTGQPNGFLDGGAASGSSSGSSQGSSGASSGDNGSVSGFGTGGPEGGPGPGGTCNVTDPNADMDHDTWSPNQGDCNDCDPNVNPGAIDVLHQNDGGPPTWGDEDCDGMPGNTGQSCDQGLALDDVVAGDAAKAIELCVQATASDRKYGVISAAYVRADGTPFAAPGLQVGIEPSWGPNVHVQAGQNMLALSCGHARTVGQPGACNNLSCQIQSGTAPTGFPQDDPACPPTPAIFDDVALELQVRVPSNATGYSFNFKFHSFEYPDWVCDKSGYNDQFIALVTPPPMGAYVPTGSTGGNISFDGNSHPVSVNMGFFDVCDPSTPKRFASHCTGACPALPSPYCPLGLAELQQTGFDVWHSGGPTGATRWLVTQAPAQPASVIKIRFAIWDAGNGQFDSTVLVDNFHWIATGGSVAVGTMPAPLPK
jgi:hypothetical protein